MTSLSVNAGCCAESDAAARIMGMMQADFGMRIRYLPNRAAVRRLGTCASLRRRSHRRSHRLGAWSRKRPAAIRIASTGCAAAKIEAFCAPTAPPHSRCAMSVFTNPASHSKEQGAAYTAAILDLLGDQEP